MALYISTEQVKLRLKGKVRFTDDDEDENRMHESLLSRLINEAEGEVEHDLSPRYMAPFQTDDEGAFSRLPERPTKELLKTLCELKAVIRVLETDFGSGSVVDSEKYTEKLQKRYDSIYEKLMKKKKEDTNQWMYPPLPSLRLNYMNTEADDGYAGMVHVTSQGDGGYPAKQINDPSDVLWNGNIDE